MKKNYIICLSILLGFVWISDLPAQRVWERMADMPQATSWYGSCYDSISEKAYIFGGSGPSESLLLLATTQIYDFKTDTWSLGTDMVNKASAFSAEMVNGKIYIIGEVLRPQVLTNVKEYDPVEDIWTTKAQLPEIFYGHGSCVYEGLIYSFGGRANSNTINTVRTYDPSTDTWNELKDMPYNREKSAVCIYEDEIYLFGGNPSLKYTPLDSSWTELDAGICEIDGYAVPIVDGDSILLFGGYKYGGNYPNPSNEMWVYYPASDTLVEFDYGMPFNRFTRGHKYNNGVYLFGGHYNNTLGSVTSEVWGYIYPDDIGIDTIIQPSSGVFLTNAEPVVVQIRNFGVNDQSDFDVSFMVNDGSLVIETITDTIPRGQTYEYTFTATADLSAEGTYSIQVCTILEGDFNPDNDCLTKMVVHGTLEYCEATTNVENEWISKVICGSISQESDWQGGVADYTESTDTIPPGGTEPIYIINGLPYPGDYVSVWVDWNNDTTFQIDSEEEIYLINDGGANEVYYGNIEAPFGLAEGNYRMRVRLARNDDPNPCGTDEYGEVEDYTIVVDSVYVGIEPADHLVKIKIHPNPFSKSVTIDIELKKSGLTQINIYNHLGEQIEFIEQNQSQGKQQIVWNAEGLPAGVYYCVLKTESGTQTMKMIKLK